MMGADFLEETRCLYHRDELAEILSYYAADRQLRKKPQLYPMTTVDLAAIEGMVRRFPPSARAFELCIVVGKSLVVCSKVSVTGSGC